MVSRTIKYLSVLLLCLLQGCIGTPELIVEPNPEANTNNNNNIVTSVDPTSEWFSRVTQGDDDNDDPYPSVCSLHSEDGSLIAGGILIRPNVVLTAGHCISDDDVYSIKIGDDEEIAVANTILHPYYSDYFGRVRNDIGLIFLECDSSYEPATIGCVEWMSRYQDITTVGYSYGYKKYSKEGVFRYFGTVVEEPNYLKFIPRETSLWFGDSGGGIFAEFQGDKYLVGVISHFVIIETYGDRELVSECSAVIIANYIDWINESVSDDDDNDNDDNDEGT
tara:strand:+ start:84 stop:917 length:834 start_codon:yes stop_codon:yes gene_type:complete